MHGWLSRGPPPQRQLTKQSPSTTMTAKFCPLNMSAEELTEYTSEWTGERDAGGRPLVPDDILERMANVSVTQAWCAARRADAVALVTWLPLIYRALSGAPAAAPATNTSTTAATSRPTRARPSSAGR